MSLLKGVMLVQETELDPDNLTGNEGLGVGIAVTKLAANHITGQEHLKSPHAHLVGIGLVVRGVIGIHIDQLDHPIRVGSRGGDVQIRHNGTGNTYLFLQHLALVDQNVGPAVNESLILHDPQVPLEGAHLRGIGHRLAGIADKGIERFR